MKLTKFGKIRALLCLLLSVCLVFALAACDPGTQPAESKITLAPATVSVEVEKTATVTATLTGITGDVVWTSSDEAVATVAPATAANSKIATVKGVKAGPATITATAGGKTATCAVTVTAAQPGPDVGPETVSIKLGDAAVGTDPYNVHVDGTVTFTATASKNSAITWESSNTEVATVAGGVVTGVAAGEAVITAKVSDEIKATVSVKVVAPTAVAFSGENEAAFVSGWRYWKGEGDAAVTSCAYYAETGELVIKYSMTNGVFYSVQLFYKDKLAGIDHDVSLTVVSPIETNITVNNAKQELSVGENEVTVEHFSGSTIAVQFGVYNENTVTGTDLVFVFKDVTLTSHALGELEAPAFTYAADTKVVTITDENNDTEKVQKYVLGLFAHADDEVPAYMVDAVSGSAVNLDTVLSGTYTVKIRANGVPNVITSDWSESLVTVEWTNPKTPLVFKANEDIVDGSKTWYVWHRNWGETHEQASYEEAYLLDGDIYLKGIVSPKIEVWDVQLFYKGEAFTKLTVTVTASQAGKITINGVVTDLEAGVAKTIEITAGSPNVSIQMGGEAVANNLQGDVTLSNITFE